MASLAENCACTAGYSFNYGAIYLMCLDVEDLYDAANIQQKTGEKKYLQHAVDWIVDDLNSATAQNKWKIKG